MHMNRGGGVEETTFSDMSIVSGKTPTNYLDVEKDVDPFEHSDSVSMTQVGLAVTLGCHSCSHVAALRTRQIVQNHPCSYLEHAGHGGAAQAIVGTSLSCGWICYAASSANAFMMWMQLLTGEDKSTNC